MSSRSCVLTPSAVSRMVNAGASTQRRVWLLVSQCEMHAALEVNILKLRQCRRNRGRNPDGRTSSSASAKTSR
jgi:hypothetical protein